MGEATPFRGQKVEVRDQSEVLLSSELCPVTSDDSSFS